MSTIRALADCADQRLFLSGERIYCEGDQADFLFLVVEGSCHLYSSGGSGATGTGGAAAGWGGAAGVGSPGDTDDVGMGGTTTKEVVVGRVGSGGVVGELSLVPQSSRLVTCAVAPQSFRGEALLLCFEADLVLRLMSRDPTLSRAVATHVLRRLDKERQRLETRGQSSARGEDVERHALRTFSADGDVKVGVPNNSGGPNKRSGSGDTAAGSDSFGLPKRHAWATLRKSVVTLGPSDRASLLRASVAAGLSSSVRGSGVRHRGGARRRHGRPRGTGRQRTATANEILSGPGVRIGELTHQQGDTKKAK